MRDDELMMLAFEYLEGNNERRDVAKAIPILENLAEKGCSTAQFCLGEIYWNGTGVPIDNDKAIHWYTLAGENGHPLVQLWLGNNFFIGIRTPVDYSLAAYWYKKAAENNVVLAQYHLGVCYSLGLGLPKSDSTALYWMEKAADQYYLDAMLFVAESYESGIGTAIDMIKCRDIRQRIVSKYYLKALESADIAIKLAHAYLSGKGLEKNPDEAVKLLSGQCVQNIEEAQCLLAECYEQGNGVEKDILKAKIIYESINNPSDKTKNRLKLLCLFNNL